MSLPNGVFTPVPKQVSAPQICSSNKLSSEEKTTEGEDRNSNSASLQILGSSLSGIFPLRRNSAFSICEPNFNLEDIKNQSESQYQDFSSKSVEQHPKRIWKREKKDKREMSRLETKNLNRYFRSKINEMLRDIKENPKNQAQLKKAEKVLEILNRSNKIMFSQIRQIIKDEWLQQKLLSCTGVLLKYIHAGKMGMQSKLIMLKYFNKILKAIRNPSNFTCWK